MAVKTETDIRTTIKEYIDGWGGQYSSWYVGIAANPRDRLFSDHGVNEEGAWIFDSCASSAAARHVEEYFINLGCDGGTGGGDESTKAVYAYMKQSHTNP